MFGLVRSEFAESIRSEFVNVGSQLDILIDILIKDGNAILKQDWFGRLYEKELKEIKRRANELNKLIIDEKSDIEEARKRNYRSLKSSY